MTHSVFDFSDYKSYLRSHLGAADKRSGMKSAIARATGCHTSYVSQVINGTAHFSLEQAQKLNLFFQHSGEESDFFLNLVILERAGTAELRAHFEEKIKASIEKRLNIETRLGVKGVLTENDQARYYSSWYFAAIHVALSISELQTPDRLAKYFNLQRKKVTEVLDFLVEKGLGRRQGTSYKIGPKHLHLGKGSANITKHHTNWRTQALISLDRDMEKDVHYSSVVTLSKTDTIKIKDRVIQAIQEILKEIEKSPEEEVYCYSVDFFSLGER